MIVCLYKWKLAVDKVALFENGWCFATEHYLVAGSLGSRLHKDKEGLYYAYAQWPDEESRGKHCAKQKSFWRRKKCLKQF